MLNIIGGTYLEKCIEPNYSNLFGSGLRAAVALANKGFDIKYHSCVSEKYKKEALYKCSVYDIQSEFRDIANTTEFSYYHPLSTPNVANCADSFIKLGEVSAKNVLYYGLLEGFYQVKADYAVYDPQNQVDYYKTKSEVKHLAIVLNSKEANFSSKTSSQKQINVAKNIANKENAEVVVIKDGPNGAYIYYKSKLEKIPAYESEKVWKIGSGDIFSSVFAWKWMIEKKHPVDSASQASLYTANYCDTQHLPLKVKPSSFKKLTPKKNSKVYLAAPFYTMGERYLVNEVKKTLEEFGCKVFSPYHDVGIPDNLNDEATIKEIVRQDLRGIDNSDCVFAIASNLDAGTIFEIGYAVKSKKRIIIFAENIKKADLTMLEGSGCRIVHDLTTALYMASW